MDYAGCGVAEEHFGNLLQSPLESDNGEGGGTQG